MKRNSSLKLRNAYWDLRIRLIRNLPDWKISNSINKVCRFRCRGLESQNWNYQLHVLTIPERLEWTRLKNVFNSIKSPLTDHLHFFQLSTNTRCSRKFPLIKVPSGRTKFVGNSITLKSVKSWNSLPKSWDFDTLPQHSFKKIVIDLLVSIRKEVFVQL